MFHVKTALSVDDAQICVVPNGAWAALALGRPVTIVFDGSAVISVAKGCRFLRKYQQAAGVTAPPG